MTKNNPFGLPDIAVGVTRMEYFFWRGFGDSCRQNGRRRPAPQGGAPRMPPRLGAADGKRNALRFESVSS